MKKRCFWSMILVCALLLMSLSVPVYSENPDPVVLHPNGGEKFPVGSTQAITWEGYEANEFDIYLSIDSGNTFDHYVGSASGGSFSWTVPDLSTDQARIKVTATIQTFTHFQPPFTVEDISDADFSIGRLPEAPTDLTASALSSSEIELNWTDNANNEQGFSIERNQHLVFTVGENVETAVHASLPPNTLYSYRVRAFNTFGYSAYSNTVRVSTLAEVPELPDPPMLTPPEAPSNLVAEAVSETEIQLTWQDNADDEEGFIIYRDVPGTEFIYELSQPAENLESHTFSSLDPNTSYTFWVKAFNAAGLSESSNEASARTFPEPIDTVIPEFSTVIQLFIDRQDYFVNDLQMRMDAAPLIREGRTLLPIRYVAEPLGAVVEWEAAERKVIIILEDTAVELWIDENRARVNGAYQHIDASNHDVKPIIAPPGRTMLPLRFIAEALGCQVDWDAVNRGVTVQFDPEHRAPADWSLPEFQEDCSEHVIDFEDLDPGTEVFQQYGSLGISFPYAPRIIEVGDVGTASGKQALSAHHSEEFSGKLVIEFTTGQSCVSLDAGLLEGTDGNKILVTLEAFDAEKAKIVPDRGMDLYPAEQVAIQQRLIGPGPSEIGSRMFVETGEEALIRRVELSYTGGYTPVMDDLRFESVGEPFSPEGSAPRVTIETPLDGEYLSGFETFPGAFGIAGTIIEDVKLQEVGIWIRQGDQIREGTLPFGGAGDESTYTFGVANLHGLIFPGENEIRVWAKSFSGITGYSQIIRVHYEPLTSDAEAELLILTPEAFYEALKPLEDWKNNTGIPAHIMTLEAIQQESRFDMADSRDLPERVKKAIARAYTHHGTHYVMLVGDGDRFPVRYHEAGREGVDWHWGLVYPITELYYACLFKPDGTFDNWDGNNNDIIGEWWEPNIEHGVRCNVVAHFGEINIDDCGLKPHVAVGRVPASTSGEVAAYVSKVLEYEMQDTSLWFERAVLWNSNSDFRQDHVELTHVADELLPGFTTQLLLRHENYENYSSVWQNELEKHRKEEIMEEINSGVGFAIFFGHGSRRALGPINAPGIADLENHGKYPIFIASACDTAKFVHEFDIYMDLDGNYPPCWPYCMPPHLPEPQGWEDPRPEPKPIQPSNVDVESMAEVLLLTPNKGGVGFLGAVSGTNHASHPYVKQVIATLNQDGVTRLGDMWTTGVQEFVEQYLEVEHQWEQYGNLDFGRNPFQSRHINIYVLFGDPSLRIR